MPLRHFLNALVQDAEGGLPCPGNTGWTSNENFLKRYITSVNVGDLQLEADNLAHSVPSVFQRPIQFEKALNEAKNPLHKAICGEWRGLLALICLQDWISVRVEAKQFVAPGVDLEHEESRVGSAEGGDLHFRAAIRYQLPARRVMDYQRVQGANGPDRISDWNSWEMIYCVEGESDTGARQLLGATSPWSLVYTAAQYKAPESIPWQRNGKLIDPIDFFDPERKRENVLELAMLHAWVTKRLSEQAEWEVDAHLADYTSRLAGRLTEWQMELAPYADASVTINGAEESCFELGVASSILRTIKEFKGDESEIFIRVKGEPGKILFFHEKLAPNTRVYRGIRANRVDMKSLDVEGYSFRTRDGVKVSLPYIIAERFVLAEKILEFDLSKDAFGEMTATPVRARFFRYFGYPELEKKLSVRKTSSSCTVALPMTLCSGKTVVLQKEYRGEEMPGVRMGNAAMALWPSGYDRQWKEHFAAFAAMPCDLRVCPLDEQGRSAPQFADGHRSATAEKPVRIWALKQPAIGFAISVYNQDESISECGVVLRSNLEAIRDINPSLKWRVGVDFGTSSTMVMMAEGEGEVIPEALALPSSVMALIEPDRTQGMQDQISRNLYPKDDVQSPFQTLLFDMEGTATMWKEGQNANAPAYAIRFASNLKQDTQNLPIANLKWGMGHRNGGNPLRAYLGALVRYIVWAARSKGVGSIEFNWSYPTSLTPGPLTEMKNFWGSVNNDSHQWHDGMSVSVPKCMTEAEASCRAITALTGAPATRGLSVTVDIGGGSTDIAFWSQMQLLEQVSFNVAGSDIFDRRYLKDNVLKDFLEFCTGSPTTNEESVSAGDRADIYINGALVSTKMAPTQRPSQHPVPLKMFREGAEVKEPWIRFRTLGYIFFSAICYYIGFKARKIAGTDPTITIYFGGRGSSMLSWIAAGNDTLKQTLTAAVRGGLNRLADDGIAVQFPTDGEPAITFHGQALADDFDSLPALKSEVAYGMLKERTVIGVTDGTDSTTVDETGWSRNGDSTSLKWVEEISRASLFGVRPPRGGIEGTIMGTYIFDFLNPTLNKSLQQLCLDEKRLAKLKLSGQDVAQDIGMVTTSQEQTLQPIFAFELKSLMKKYAAMA